MTNLNPNPFRMPNNPNLTIREVLCWIAGGGAADSAGVAKNFAIERNDSCMRLLRLHRMGYLRRQKTEDGTFAYELTAFGRKTATKWGRK